MLTIGLLGGVSWEGTAEYYKVINRRVSAQLGGLHSARILMYSFDFDEIHRMQSAGRWTEIGVVIADQARALERAGADVLVLCTNTLHRVAKSVAAAVQITLIHIVDATAESLMKEGVGSVALLGTRLTMESDDYLDRLRGYGIKVVVPGQQDRELVDRVIFEELVRGIVRASSRHAYLDVIDRLATAGAEAVVLGCTEIGLLVQQSNTKVRLFDTTIIHAQVTADFALGLGDLPLPQRSVRSVARPQG